MSEHRCRTPAGRQPIELVEWTCAECGQSWEREPRVPINPAPAYDFATKEHVMPARWVRIETGVAS